MSFASVDGLVLGVEGLQGQHRPEDLLAHDLAPARRLDEQRRLVVGAARHGLARLPPNTGSAPCARARSHEALDAREVIGVDQRADHRRRIVERASRCAWPGARSANRRWNSSMTGRSTSSRVPARQTWPALSYCSMALSTASVEVGVGEHEERRLAAELERERREVLGRGARDPACRRDRAGERDARDAGVARRARRRPPRRCPARRSGRPAAGPPRRPGRRAASTRAAPTPAASAPPCSPAASAGPTFQVESMNGAFQGVISAATPAGS